MSYNSLKAKWREVWWPMCMSVSVWVWVWHSERHRTPPKVCMWRETNRHTDQPSLKVSICILNLNSLPPFLFVGKILADVPIFSSCIPHTSFSFPEMPTLHSRVPGIILMDSGALMAMSVGRFAGFWSSSESGHLQTDHIPFTVVTKPPLGRF